MQVTLTIPKDRSSTSEWISKQRPDVIADIFSVSEELFKFTLSLTSVHESDNVAQMARQHLCEKSEQVDTIVKIEKEKERLRLQLISMEQTVESRAAEISQRQIQSHEDFHKEQIAELRQNHSKTLELTCSRYENEVLKLGLETDGLKQQLVMSVDTERATNSQLTDMLKESTKVLKQFTKDVDSGFMGEELVRKVFAALGAWATGPALAGRLVTQSQHHGWLRSASAIDTLAQLWRSIHAATMQPHGVCARHCR